MKIISKWQSGIPGLGTVCPADTTGLKWQQFILSVQSVPQAVSQCSKQREEERQRVCRRNREDGMEVLPLGNESYQTSNTKSTPHSS